MSGRGAGLGLRGLGGARPPRHTTTATTAVFVQLVLRWGRNWAAQWHLTRAVGKRFRGCCVKCLYVDMFCSKSKGSRVRGGRGEHAVVVILPRQEGVVKSCPVNSPGPWRRVVQR